MREQAQLLVLDAIFHVTAGTVEFVVQVLIGLRQVGYDKTWIAPQAVVFCFHNHASGFISRASGVVHGCKQTLTATTAIEQIL